MKILRLGSLFLLILGLSLRGAIAGETGHAVRDVDVRSEPRNDAPVTFKLAKGARYELLERKLSWARVSVGGREGWTLFYFLMSGEPPTPQSPGFAVSELWKFGSDRPSTGGGITATLGTRGLDDAQLAAARFNARELEQLESMSLPPQSAAVFAAEAGLAVRQVEPLAAPAPLAGSVQGAGN